MPMNRQGASSEYHIGTRTVPAQTIDWLREPDNPAVSALTRRWLLGEADDEKTAQLWSHRNDYPPVAAILEAQAEDGSWDVPSRDYQKYRGSLWQIHLLGELNADGSDERIGKAAEYAFSRQLDDGSWSATNMRAAGSITCLTANVGRALASMGWDRDERVVAALRYCVDLYEQIGAVDCRSMVDLHLNGYCHMLTPKILLFLAVMPRDLWPEGASSLRSECIAKLRDKQVFRSLPEESREYEELFWSIPANERSELREQFMTEHPVLHYKAKPGWLRFGFPLSYNSDALEALAALARSDEPRRPEYEDALQLVEDAADESSRWTLKNSFNGKMHGDVEKKGKPSKWLTLRALLVLQHFSEAVNAH